MDEQLLDGLDQDRVLLVEAIERLVYATFNQVLQMRAAVADQVVLRQNIDREVQSSNLHWLFFFLSFISVNRGDATLLIIQKNEFKERFKERQLKLFQR